METSASSALDFTESVINTSTGELDRIADQVVITVVTEFL